VDLGVPRDVSPVVARLRIRTRPPQPAQLRLIASDLLGFLGVVIDMRVIGDDPSIDANIMGSTTISPAT
jgi:hypothetical protein